jgi:cytoskeletal protein RodZ
MTEHLEGGAAPPDPVEQEEAAPDVASFGRWLVRQRELRDLSREEVGRLTKLGTAIVEALESGAAERMPPRAYLLGYLRSWATVVGLDPDDVVLRWQEVDGAAEGGEAPATAPARPLPVNLVVVALVGLAILLAVGLLAASFRRPGSLSIEHPRATPDKAPYYQPEAAPAGGK